LSSEIVKKIFADLVVAMKGGEKLRTSVLRMTKSELNKAALDKGVELDDAAAIAVLNRELKRREEAAEAFGAAGRQESAENEKKEAEILKSYLPTQLTAEEVEKIVADVVRETGATSPRDMGKVMKPIMAKVAGRADGKLVKQIVDKTLASL
jgi:uncharacterized protein